MERILVLAHAEPGVAGSQNVLECLAVAKQLQSAVPGAELTIGLCGSGAQGMADSLAGVASRFIAVAAPEFDVSRYATDAAAAETLCKASSASIVLAPNTSRWQRCLPGAAQRLGGFVDTHVSGVSAQEGKIHAQRWFYRQRMEGAISRGGRPWVLLLDPGVAPPSPLAPGNANLEIFQANSVTRTSVLGFHEPVGDAKTVKPDAELLLVAGAGWTKKQSDGSVHSKEAEQIIGTCLKLARASLGSTKSLVDLGGEGQAILPFLTHLNQVGQTGSTPRHKKGLATCCHGEEPHTVGWRFITERRAINLDPNCGWARGKADVLYVADAFAVMKRVNDLLASP